MDMGN